MVIGDPSIEVAYYADALGIGRPYPEPHPFSAIPMSEVCAQFLMKTQMLPFAHQMMVEFTKIIHTSVFTVE